VKQILAPLIAVALLGTSPAGQQDTRSSLRAFTCAQVIGAGVAASATILVRDGRIEAIGPRTGIRIPPGTPVTDLAGKFIIAGLVTAHAHISDVDGLRPRAYTAANTVRQLGVFARYGVTTVWSFGGEQAPAFQARDEQSTPSLDRARIHVAGDVIAGSTPAEARQAVARVAAMKPDLIKIRVDDNLGATAKMAPEVYRAVIEEAHARKLRLAAHIFYLDDAKQLLRAGADIIAHSVRDKDVDDEFISLMKAQRASYIPTLTREISTFVYESTPAFFTDPFFLKEADPAVVAQLKEPARQAAMRESKPAQRYKIALDVAKRNLKRLSDAGVTIAMGTDAGPFPERFQGYFEHLEMEMMVDAGMTPAQVLRASTGSLKAGEWADFVALDADPRADIRNTRKLAGVWIAGNPVPKR
jgi:imidazolonepropionase-like amidohydrolase